MCFSFLQIEEQISLMRRAIKLNRTNHFISMVAIPYYTSIYMFVTYTVESFDFMGAYFRGLWWFFLLIRGV